MFLHGQEFYTERGYTALNDVVIDPQEADAICQAYAELEQEGKLLIKVNVSILVNNNEN